MAFILVPLTSMQRHGVAPTFMRRCINAMCPLGHWWTITETEMFYYTCIRLYNRLIFIGSEPPSAQSLNRDIHWLSHAVFLQSTNLKHIYMFEKKQIEFENGKRLKHWPDNNISRFSLSRGPRDSLKHFEISVLWHIRFAESEEKIIEESHVTNEYMQFESWRARYIKEEKLPLGAISPLFHNILLQGPDFHFEISNYSR